MPLNVIGAGIGRTGTQSLKFALEQLGAGPCHHMIEVFRHPEQFALWEQVFDERPLDWEEVFAGYRSSCDAPSVFVYRELAEHYPSAKVILTTRDPESWWRSASATIISQSERTTGHAPQGDTPLEKMMAKAKAYQARRAVLRAISRPISRPRPRFCSAIMRRCAARSRRNDCWSMTSGMVGGRCAASWASMCPTHHFRTPIRPRSFSRVLANSVPRAWPEPLRMSIRSTRPMAQYQRQPPTSLRNSINPAKYLC